MMILRSLSISMVMEWSLYYEIEVPDYIDIDGNEVIT